MRRSRLWAPVAVLAVLGVTSVARGGGVWWPDTPIGKADLQDVWAGQALEPEQVWGRIVLVVYWKTGDKASLRAMSDIDAMARRYKRSGVVGIAGYLGAGDARRVEVLKRGGSDVRDLTVIPGERIPPPNVKVWPCLVVLDHQGRGAWQGYPDTQTLTKTVVPLLTKLVKQNPGHPVLDTAYPYLPAAVGSIRRNRLGASLEECRKRAAYEGKHPTRLKIAAQAKLLQGRLEAYASWYQMRASAAKEEAPSRMRELYRRLAELYAGSDIGKRASKKLGDLANDPVFEAECKAEPSYQNIKRLVESAPPRPSGGPEREAWDTKYAKHLERLKEAFEKMEEEHSGTTLVERARKLIEGESKAVTIEDMKAPDQKSKQADPQDPTRRYPTFPWAGSALAKLEFRDVWSGPKLGPDDLIGNVVMLVFFKHDDKLSLRVLGKASKLARPFRSAGLVAVAVSTDGDKAKALEAARGAGVYYTVIHLDKVGHGLRVKALPKIYIYQHNGHLAWTQSLTSEMVEKLVTWLKARPGHPVLDGTAYKHIGPVVTRIKRDRLGDALNLCRKSKDAGGKLGTEARQLLGLLEGYGGWLLGRVGGEPKAAPAASIRMLERVRKLYAKTEIGEEAGKRLKALTADEEFRREQSAEPNYVVIARMINALPLPPRDAEDREQWDKRFGRRVVEIQEYIEKMKTRHPEAAFTERAERALSSLLAGRRAQTLDDILK